MPGLRLDIEVNQAQRDLADALQKMRNMASQGIKTKLILDASDVTRDINKTESRVTGLRRELARPIKMNANMSEIKEALNLIKAASNSDFKNVFDKIKKDSGSLSDSLGKYTKKMDDSITSYRKILNDRKLTDDATYSKQLKDMQSMSKQAKQLQKDIKIKEDSGISISDDDVGKVAKLASEMERVSQQSKNMRSAIKADNIVGVEKMYQDVDKALNSVLAKRTQLVNNQSKKSTFQDPSIQQSINELNEYEAKLRSVQTSLSTMKGAVPLNDALNFNDLIQQSDEAVSKVQSNVQKLTSSMDSVDIDSQKMRAFDKLGNRMTTYFNQYEAQIMRNADIYDKYRTTLSKIQSGSFKTIEDANNAFASFRMEARRAGVEVESIGSRLQQTFGVRVRSALAGEGVWMLESALRDVVANAIDVDTAMTEVKKVTNETDSTYAKFLSEAGNRAQNLGATLTEVVNATAD